MMLRKLIFSVLGSLVLANAVFAQEDRPPVSQCQLIAQTLPDVRYARFEGGPLPIERAAIKDEVVITFLGHSTFEITTPNGLTIATDWSGWLRSARLPDIVTMNKAHSSHYTLSPDPGIAHVLHGWADTPGEKAKHNVVIDDAFVRNVTSDIRSFGGFEENGNSIFIFEIAGLCIGHLGHLHQELTDGQYAEIGRLDIVMVPVDGGLTMGPQSMSLVIQRLRSALILPMHRVGPPVDAFVEMFDSRFDVSYSAHSSVTVSMRNLPKKPLILVLKGG